MKLTAPDKIVFSLSILFIVSLYWGLWQASDEAYEVEIFISGEKNYRLDLHENKRLAVKGKLGDSIIEIKDGQARFISSPCNTSFCVRNGWQSHGGDFAACLPNAVSLHLVGGGKIYDAINF
ncbi:MAG: NusG domain II-containing protein [Gammaproteobacteria bacterium]|nr:NusG domain II-containing protein [Gammaproteobacteria bacterium]